MSDTLHSQFLSRILLAGAPEVGVPRIARYLINSIAIIVNVLRIARYVVNSGAIINSGCAIDEVLRIARYLVNSSVAKGYFA